MSESRSLVAPVGSHHVHPGEIFITREGRTISTVLGSCVAVCLWDKSRKAGGMNHVMLPRMRDDEPASTRYANVASFVLYEMMRAEGCMPINMTAKIFGGANAMARYSLEEGSSGINVGKENIEITEKVLTKLKIKVVGKDLGGQVGRKILFDTATGQIKMQYLRRFDFDEEIREIKSM